MYILAGVLGILALIGALTVGCWIGLLCSWAWFRFQAWRHAGRSWERLDALCNQCRGKG